LISNEKRYPPKAIIGLAARRTAGRVLTPYDFKGGEQSRCFRILRELGFTIESKLRIEPQGDVAIDEEREYRFGLWDKLKGSGGPLGVSPSLLRELGR
jgi:hypothetical protein